MNDGRCQNPHCHVPDAGIRSPTDEELDRFLRQSDEEAIEPYRKGEVQFTVCEGCGVWTTEVKGALAYIPPPFSFELGDRVKVVLEGSRFGMVGTVTERRRISKLIFPVAVPANHYWVRFKEHQNEEAFEESNLEAEN